MAQMYGTDESNSVVTEPGALHEVEEALQDQGDGLSGVAVIDSAGRICYLNAAWRQLIGSRDADALRLGNNYIEVLEAMFEPENRAYAQTVARNLRAVLQCERTYVELTYPHNRAGHWRWFLVCIRGYSLSTEQGALIEQHDVTCRLKARAVGA